LLGLIPYFERWRERQRFTRIFRGRKNERFILGRGIMSDGVLNKDAAVAFVTSD
jgi:hypothetical protein